MLNLVVRLDDWDSKISAKDDEDNALYGGGVYAAPGSVIRMTGGTINKNESEGDGAGSSTTRHTD